MHGATIENEVDFLTIIDVQGLKPGDFISYYKQNETAIDDILLKKGAVKFQGVRIEDTGTFQQIVDSISDKFLNYIDGSSPRTKLSDHVYTSTEYDKSQKITMHNELSYSAKWPNKLFFSCLEPAETGGQTLLADSREILQKMNKDIISEISHKGVVYIRNLHGGDGVGASWQNTFETEDKGQVETYCKAYSIDYEWLEEDCLRLRQPSKGIIGHRKTNEKVWFNQIDQFHPYQLGEKMVNALMAIYDTPEEFPTYVTFGDGTPISDDMIKEILDTIGLITVAPPWQTDEILILDNELMSHGRNPFTGSRKVLVSMSE